MSGSRGVETSTLRRAVAGPTALAPLMQTHPARAAELILAATLREPHSRDWMGLADFGIVDRIVPDSPLPERGPMLAFFMHAPEVALATLGHIVDHATAGWAESEMADVDDQHISAPFEVRVDGEWVTLAGNGNVMHWHRGDARVPGPLACALMALEQFLYRKLDAGEDVADILAELMTSRSVAIFGVLVEVACYRPELLRGPLAPMATSAALILADRIYKHTDHAYLRLTFDPGELRRLDAWHNMPHRTRRLEDQIMPLAVAEGVLVEELAAAREMWAQAPDNRWRFLIAQMDPANYKASRLGGRRSGLCQPCRQTSMRRGSASGFPRQASRRGRDYGPTAEECQPVGTPDGLVQKEPVSPAKAVVGQFADPLPPPGSRVR